MVWLASTAAAADAAWLAARLGELHASEVHRLARLTRTARRAQFVAVHAVARRLLGAQRAAGAAAVGLTVEPDGRPVLADSSLGISLSHSADRVAAAAAPARIGVDIERLRDGRGRDVIEPWALAEARWKAGDAQAPAWVADAEGFVLAVAGCAAGGSAHWCDLREPVDAPPAALALCWRFAGGGAP